MNNISKKIICILMVCSFIVISFGINNAYAATAEEELVQVLDEYKDDIGDIEAFGKVMDKLYQDISSATEVNDELKAKLKADVNELASVPDINPIILQILDVELKSQIENLDESNIQEMQQEVLVMKQWAESNKPSGDNTNNQTTNNVTPSNNTSSSIPTNTINSNYANKILPYAGRISTIIIFAVILILVVNAIVLKIKYGQFKGIK